MSYCPPTPEDSAIWLDREPNPHSRRTFTDADCTDYWRMVRMTRDKLLPLPSGMIARSQKPCEHGVSLSVCLDCLPF